MKDIWEVADNIAKLRGKLLDSKTRNLEGEIDRLYTLLHECEHEGFDQEIEEISDLINEYEDKKETYHERQNKDARRDFQKNSKY